MRKCDKDIIDAAFEWFKDSPCSDCVWELSGEECELYNNHGTKLPCFKLRGAIKKHPDFKKKDNKPQQFEQAWWEDDNLVDLLKDWKNKEII